jgi:alkylation response protein AidB-like acyl-CoA dehydrogenase
MERSALDLQLSEEQTMLRDTVRSFAAEHVAPRHEALDHAAVHPGDVAAGMAELGLFGILAPSEIGGVGMGMLAHVVAVEELAAAGGVAGGILCAHGVALDAILSSDAGRDAASGLVSGERFAAPAFVARSGAPDTAAAAAGGGDVRLSGERVQVPFPGRAGAFAVLGPAREVLLVPAGAAGVVHEGRDRALGLLGLETAPLVLKDAKAVRLGGPEAAVRALASARIQVSALLCGLGCGALSHAHRYANERKQFDRLLIDFAAIQERLARGAAAVAAARALVHDAARLRDLGEPWGQAAARARLAAGEAAMLATDNALQVYGGYGYSREYPAERFYRDARFPGFGEGDPGALIEEIARNLG